MSILVVDTSSDYGVVVLAGENGDVKASSVFEGRRTLSRRLLAVIDDLLRANALALRDLAGLAVGVGPGSFTGLRVGLTTLRTFAQVTGLPLVGVNTLDAYAEGITGGTVVTAMPSRRGEVYASFGDEDSEARPVALSIQDFSDRCAELSARTTVVLCGHPDTLASIDVPGIKIMHACPPAAGFARIAARKLSTGHIANPLSLVPLYVVPPAISTPRDTSILPAHV